MATIFEVMNSMNALTRQPTNPFAGTTPINTLGGNAFTLSGFNTSLTPTNSLGLTTNGLGLPISGTATGTTTPVTADQSLLTALGVTGATNTTGGQTIQAAATDQRVRLAHLSGYSNPYPGIIAPLAQTQGLMFPYTPTIAVSQDVTYVDMQMTHSNTDYYSFARSPNTNVTITAKFTVQNQQEGKYVMACLHFLRSVSRMNFGQNDSQAGLPPPILTLTGYGSYMFNKMRCFLKQHSYTLEDTVDYVPVKLDNGTVNLPSMFTVSLSLTSQQTPRAMRQDFTLDKYRSGELLASGGWI